MFPLWKMKRSGIATRGAGWLLGYFVGLGIGFIFIEIAFIQRCILFIGYPVYAVATILFSLLVSAGLGSFLSRRFTGEPLQILRKVVVAILVVIVIQVYVVPLLFAQLLAASFPWRVGLSILFLFPAGLFLGMAFPVGLTWTSQNFPGFVPWAWGMNGYATVIGSVLSVILALNFGFRAVLLIAVAIYLLAYLSLRRAAVILVGAQASGPH